VPASCIHGLVQARRRIDAELALRLVRYIGGDARSWLNLQAAYDLRVAEQAIGKRIEREITPAV
jgi:addiction module HigA family antidote